MRLILFLVFGMGRWVKVKLMSEFYFFDYCDWFGMDMIFIGFLRGWFWISVYILGRRGFFFLWIWIIEDVVFKVFGRCFLLSDI